MEKFQVYIDGKFQNAASGEMSTVYNPATGEAVFEVPKCGIDEVNAAVDAAHAAQKLWRKKTPMERAVYVKNLIAEVRADAENLALTLAKEHGKTLIQSRGEVARLCDLAEYHLGWDRRIEGEVLSGDNNKENIFVMKEPIGVVACIMPWNFPIVILIRKIAPALITGCTVVCKPSAETPASTLAIAKMVDRAGFPKGVVNFITGSGALMGPALCKNSKVNMITATGSVEMGQQIMEASAGTLQRLSLELGGKCPAIVMKDADLELAATCVVASRLANAGQVCTSVERLYVQREIADKFITMVKEKMEKATFGDGVKTPEHTMGAMINKASVERVHAIVERTVAQGAKLLLGGYIPEGPGAFYPPTLLTDVKQDWEIIQEEVFGPALPVIIFDTPEEALALANDCKFGLTATLYTNDYNLVMLFTNNIEFGELYVNRGQREAFHGYHAGWKLSGLGGDDGQHGMEEFLRMRTVYMDYKTDLY
jgi:lactaldehyde dehydrogenase/glycolaldehyde dehydrogenase